MMLPTHVLVGLVVAIPISIAAPELAGVAFVGGMLGGIVPDLDMYVGHRKSLHYPVYYTVFVGPSLAVALALPSVPTVFLAVLFAGAAAHSLSDVFGGGLELRPWEATSQRGVFDHYRQQWIAPKRWVQYDGSPGDLLLAYAIAVPLLAIVEGPYVWVVTTTLAVASLYAAVRRYLPTVLVTVLDTADARLSDDALSVIPRRYREARSGQSGTDVSK
ncbi:MAG: metal-dependent hydrolase [Halorhabdus sp.]